MKVQSEYYFSIRRPATILFAGCAIPGRPKLATRDCQVNQRRELRSAFGRILKVPLLTGAQWQRSHMSVSHCYSSVALAVSHWRRHIAFDAI